MPKRIMAKLTSFTAVLTITLVVTINFNNTTSNSHTDLLKSCMAKKSNLPINHNNHPCYTTYMSGQSWWSWVVSDNKSIHLHFLNLVELMHQDFISLDFKRVVK